MNMIGFLLLSLVVTLCWARPNIDVEPQNIVTVPPNCPDGQEWINGQCRDVWKAGINCPMGQRLINGQCRETWRIEDDQINAQLAHDVVAAAPPNAVTAPPNCPPSQSWFNGQCRDVWSRAPAAADIDMLPPNMITVPPNCPSGQEYINGACRDIWRAGFHSRGLSADFSESNLLNTLMNSELSAQEISSQDNEVVYMGSAKNIISVPNQCPAGYRPDALGICREIFN